MKSWTQFLAELRTTPWVVFVLGAMLVGMLLPIFPDGSGGHTTLTGFVLTWLGTIFKTMSGAVLGFWFCRKVLRVNLSEVPEGQARAIASLTVAIVVAAFVIGVAQGV